MVDVLLLSVLTMSISYKALNHSIGFRLFEYYVGERHNHMSMMFRKRALLISQQYEDVSWRESEAT